MTFVERYLDDMKHYRESSENTINSYKPTLKQLTEFLDGDYKVDRDKLKDFIISLNKRNLKATTINHKINCLKSFYKYLHESGYVDDNPTSGLTYRKTSVEPFYYLDDQLVSDLLKHAERASDVDRTMVKLMLATAVRVNVISRLKRDNFNFDKKTITFYNRKSRKTQTINLSDDVINEVKSLFDKHNNEHLFISNQGTPMSKRTVERHIKKMLKKVTKNTDLQHAHCLRHTVAMRLAQRNVSIYVIKEFLGHASITSTQKYVKAVESDIKSASEVLGI